MDNNFDRLDMVLHLEDEPDRVPFYDLFADPEVVEAITGKNLPATPTYEQMKTIARAGQCSKIAEILNRIFEIQVEFYSKLEYDYVVLTLPSPFPRENVILAEDTAPLRRHKRAWQDENKGAIESKEDFEKYPWPDTSEIDDIITLMLDILKRNLPENMKIIPLTPGGVLENVMWLMGAVNFFKALYRDPLLLEKMFQKIGSIISHYCEVCSEDELVGAISMGDDMGYKTGPMISPNFLRKYVFPWHKRCVKNVHKHGKPFILHSCGNLKLVMNDLIEYVKIDAKHSYEDTSYPVVEYKELYNDKIAILGGVDMDKLARMPSLEFRRYVMNILNRCAPGGGYALGCGNSVANYVKLENYLLMLEIGRKYGKYPIRGK